MLKGTVGMIQSIVNELIIEHMISPIILSEMYVGVIGVRRTISHGNRIILNVIYESL